jgi:inhibitor of KinA
LGIRLLPSGEQAMVIEFGDKIDREINIKVHRLTKLLAGLKDDRIIEIVPTYRSLLVQFDLARIKREELADIVQKSLASMKDGEEDSSPKKIVYVPVCYGGEFGPDMNFVMEHTKLSAEEVIAIHTETAYLVYMLGFTAGFPYLGGMSEKIATPRLKTPRTKIPAGSVGIAGSQTGLYPIESPGGWQLIGRTPIKAFSPRAENPFLFAAGDYLQFRVVSRSEYDQIAQQVESGSYTAETGIVEKGR